MRLLLLALVVFAAPASSQAPQAPCSSPEYDQLDFWLGTWDLTWPGGQGGTPEGETGRGTNAITAEYGNCVIREAFSGAGFEGGSVSIYDARSSQWRQTWVDNTGGHILFTGGVGEDGVMALRTAPFTDAQGREQVNRMIWTDVTEDTMTWRWQTSRDGSGPWLDLWTIQYTRRAD